MSNLSREDSDKLLDAFLIEHGGTVRKEHQGILPVEFVVTYLIAPFAVGMAGVWGVYLVIRLLFVGYVGRGFRT